MNVNTFIGKCLRRLVLPVLPGSLRLPFRLWLHLQIENPEPELVHLARLVSRRGVAIDAGANIGLVSLSLARICDKVYAFEINEQTSRPLKNCARKNIEIINVGLSNHTGEATLYTPIHANGTALDGWASLQLGNCPGIHRHQERKVQIRPLDAFPIPECVFFKIDVEGHEVELLEGALDTLRRTRPVIQMEVRERNMARVKALLEPLGYRRTSLQEMIGIPGGSDNVIFLPD